jgi:hypothetical protein
MAEHYLEWQLRSPPHTHKFVNLSDFKKKSEPAQISPESGEANAITSWHLLRRKFRLQGHESDKG